MLAPFFTEPSLVTRPLPVCDAPALDSGSPSLKPSSTEASMSSSFGASCSALSYLREIGRNTLSATWWALLMIGRIFFGISIFMLCSPGCAQSKMQAAEGDTNGAQVAIPALDRVFVGAAVAAEQLHAVGAALAGFFRA